ncbi:MAG TPA: type II secretion system F family protein [Candidatus Acidoferrales bacterium]|nr:type II secretion system F family protein [Candidatus Acidoferrales bacterium]
MAEFVCKVADSAGRVFSQVEAAQTVLEARQKLADRGFYVYSVRPRAGLFGQPVTRRRDRAVSSADFLIFNQQFNTLVKAGLPILKALDLLAERAGSPRLRPILVDVRERVREGASLSEALDQQAIFSKVYTTAVLAGEKSGNLTGVLDYYIAYQRVTAGFRNRLKVVLIYPTILVIAVTLILSYLVTYVIPQFAQLYADLNVPLPTLSRAMLAVALPLRRYILIVAPSAAGLALAAYLWSRSERGNLALEQLKPRIPLLGDIWLKAQVAQFVRTLSTLLAGGTPLVGALTTAAESVSSRLLARAISQTAGGVKQGQALHASLATTGLMPELALEMIEVGEASGALAAMLTSVAEFYEEEVNLRLSRILAWVEPAILILMAVVVAVILISLYLPIFSLSVGATGG